MDSLTQIALGSAVWKTALWGGIAAFSHGFFSLQNGGDRLLLTDLRMGLEPSNVFRFDIDSPATGDHVPVTQLGMRPDLARALPWLWRRLQGKTLSMLGAATP